MDKVILVVDDDSVLRASIARGLRAANFSVLVADSAEQATEILARIRVDAIILDRMMVGQDGLTFLKQLRAVDNRTPTIMLTAMGGAENTIEGLSAGADDYLAKPFQLRELILRLNNIIARGAGDSIKMPAGLSLIDGEFFITTGNQPPKLFTLSNEEKKFLENLTRPVGNIVAAQPMVAKRLRSKLNDVLSNIDIITVRGRGYKIVCQDSTQQKG